jgi:hypothetical protein
MQHAVDSTRWGKTYYYSCAKNKSGRRIAMLCLDGSFFAFGSRWMERRWLNLIAQIMKETPTDLMVFSDTNQICEEALYEIKDIRRMHKVNTVLMTNMLVTTFRSAATSKDDIVEVLKLHLEL